MAERVTLQHAARHFGVSVRTVQRRIQAGELQAEHVATARGQRVMVLLETVTPEPEPAATAHDTELSAVLAEVRADRDFLRGRITALEENVSRLTILLNQAQYVAQLPPARDDSHDKEPDSRRDDGATVTRQTPTDARPRRRRRPLWERLLAALRGA